MLKEIDPHNLLPFPKRLPEKLNPLDAARCGSDA